MGIWATRDVLHASSDGSLRHQECHRRNARPPRLRQSMWHLPDPVRASRLRPETTSTRKGALGPATSHCRTPRSAAKEVFAESFLILTMHLVVTTGPQMEPPRTAKGSTVLPLTPRPQRPTAPATAATAAPDAAEVASSEGWLARRACVPNKSPPRNSYEVRVQKERRSACESAPNLSVRVVLSWILYSSRDLYLYRIRRHVVKISTQDRTHVVHVRYSCRPTDASFQLSFLVKQPGEAPHPVVRTWRGLTESSGRSPS
jgi:hypothetical protein